VKIHIFSNHPSELYLVSATANGTLFVPGDTGFYYANRSFDVPANTTWQIYTYPGLSALGAFSVGTDEITVRVDNAGVVNLFTQPSLIVGSAWQASLPIAIPTWVRTEEGLAFLSGFFIIGTVRIYKIVSKWLTKVADDSPGS